MKLGFLYLSLTSGTQYLLNVSGWWTDDGWMDGRTDRKIKNNCASSCPCFVSPLSDFQLKSDLAHFMAQIPSKFVNCLPNTVQLLWSRIWPLTTFSVLPFSPTIL